MVCVWAPGVAGTRTHAGTKHSAGVFADHTDAHTRTHEHYQHTHGWTHKTLTRTLTLNVTCGAALQC